MANISHSTMTGTDLHENKGAAAATDNTVATVSSGATVWKKLDNTNLAALGNPFGANLLHVTHECSSGVSGDTFTASWSVATLNTTKTNEISGASLSGSQIVLPAGTYFVEGCIFIPYNTGGGVYYNLYKAKLYNVTDASDILVSPTDGCSNNSATYSGAACVRLPVRGRLVLATQKTLAAYVKHSGGNVTTQAAMSLGGVELYADFAFWRVA